MSFYSNYSIFAVIRSAKDNDTAIPHSRLPGGDFFCAREINAGDLLLIGGDVVSHGVRVSPGAFACLAVFHAMRNRNPVELLKALNRVLLKIDREDGGEALVLCMWLQANGDIMYAGGMDRLFIQRADTRKVEELKIHRIILGKEEIMFDELLPFKSKMNTGDNLLIASDGVIFDDKQDDQVSGIITYEPLGENITEESDSHLFEM